MATFNGPWSHDLDALKKAVQSMPDQYKSSFASASKDTLEKVCGPDILHVWETDSDIDNLLQLASIIAKLCNLGTRKTFGTNASDGSMIIIAEEKPGRNNFARICQLVEYLTGADGKKHLDGTVGAFGSIIVVKGWNNAIRSETASHEASRTVKRIDIALERAMRTGTFHTKKIVWHHGPVIHFLLHWINTTTSPLRAALSALTITASLDLSFSISPSVPGRSNTLPDLTCLSTYATKLSIPVLFLDSPSLLLTFAHLGTYMYYYAYYIRTFLPYALLHPHLHAAQDELVTFAFRLLGASESVYGDGVVKKVKSHLNPSTAKKWVHKAVDPAFYDKKSCRNAGKEDVIHRAVQLADAPFLRFNAADTNDLPAFARLAVGPASAASQDQYIAAAVSIDFAAARIRPAYPTPFHILIPHPSHDDVDKVTAHVQGLMMAVLERVRQEKGTPAFSNGEGEMWNEVSRAVGYALDKSGSDVPRKVKEKAKFVKERLEKGTWGFSMTGGGKMDGKMDVGGSEAARANRDAEMVVGRGMQSQMGRGVVQYGGMVAPQNSPQAQQLQGMYGPQVQHVQGYGAPGMGYTQQQQQQRGDIAYAQSQGVGGVYHSAQQYKRGGDVGGGYPQSMGGPWI
jgi:hypothetical protein